jgi:glycosyltransferase involved in cell wall biosynthesis
MGGPRVAIAVPAFNESDGIAGFLQEIDRAVSPVVGELRIIVVDDASTDATADRVRAASSSLAAQVEVLTNRRNRGHGPTLLTAYRRALDCDPEYVLQVDGDGQFHGSDLRRVLVLLIDDAHAVCGVRRFRQDPWFRMRMTALLRTYLSALFSVRARDANCPLRGYDAAVLRRLLRLIPDDCLIPNLYLTVLAARAGLPLLEVDVSHRVRRGAASRGTMWGRGLSPVPVRLLLFSARAARESLEFRATLGDRHQDSDGEEESAHALRSPLSRR